MRARVATSDKRLPNHNNNIGFAKLQLCVLSHDECDTISHKDGQHSIRWKQDMVWWLIEYFPPGNLFLYLREQSRANERCGINDIIYRSPNVFIDLPNTRSFSESKAETKNMRNGLVVPFWVSLKGANCLTSPLVALLWQSSNAFGNVLSMESCELAKRELRIEISDFPMLCTP